MKSFILSFLLIVFVLPIAGLFHIRYEIKQVKLEMKRAILKAYHGKTVTYKVQKSHRISDSFIFHSEDNELEILGKMYDIISISENGDFYVFHCLPDENETILKSKLKSLLRSFFSQNTQKQNPIKQIYKFFQSLFYSEFSIELKKNEFVHCEPLAFLYLIKCAQTYLYTSTPPPNY